MEKSGAEQTHSIDLIDGVSFQLRYFGSLRIFRYRNYRLWSGNLFSLSMVLVYAFMVAMHLLTLVFCRNIQEFTDLMYVFGLQINQIVKIYDMLSHDTRIRDLLDNLSENQIYPTQWSYRDQLQAGIRVMRFSSSLLYISACGSAIMVMLSPIINRQALPFASWFPWDISSNLGYWSAYGVEFWYVFYLSPLNITLDTMLTSLMHTVAVKLNVLCLEMGKLGISSHTCQQRNDDIKRVVKYHQEIIRMVKEIEEIFNRGIFVQCVFCGATMCIVGYRILISELFSSDFFAMVLILIAFTGEMFYYCHFGNEIKLKSEGLCNAIYASNWYSLSGDVCREHANRADGVAQCFRNRLSFAKKVFIVMERLKRPIGVTAGSLVPLTYETFISLITYMFHLRQNELLQK